MARVKIMLKQFFATVILLASSISVSATEAVTVSVEGRDYNVTTIHDSYADNVELLESQAWWGDWALASKFALEVKDQLGTQISQWFQGPYVGAAFLFYAADDGHDVYSQAYDSQINQEVVTVFTDSTGDMLYAIATPVEALFQVEAEMMALSGGYAVEDNAAASAGQLIRRRDSGGYAATASTEYTGPAGNYDIAVSYFDENDGMSNLAFLLNGQVLDEWVADEDPVCSDCASPGASTLRTRVVARAMRLLPSDKIALQGTGEHYEYARFDKLTLSPAGLSTYEAEKMALKGGYAVEDNAAASGGQLIRRRDSGGYAATASTEYTGAAGTYEIKVSYFDESDGVSSLAFLVNGEILDQWLAEEDPVCSDCDSPGASTLRTRVVARELSLQPGDEITLVGTGEHYEYARFDKLTLSPTVVGPVVFDDGGVYTIDYTIRAAEVLVKNGTTVNIRAGAHLNRLVSVYTSTAAAQNVVNVYDGEIGTIETAPRDICNIYGGAIRSVINGGTIVIDGGRIDKLYSSWDGHYVTVSNGVIGEMEVRSTGGSLTISGGTFLGNVDIISEYAGWYVAISGGLFRGDINIDNVGGTSLTFYGDLKVELVRETEGDFVYIADYFVEGTLRDGSPISTNLYYETFICCDWVPWTKITVEP